MKDKNIVKKIDKVINASHAGYYEHDINYSTGYICQRFAEILGFKLKEIPKYPKFIRWYEKRIHEDDLERFRTVHDFHNGKTTRFDQEYRIRSKNGKWIWVHSLSTVSKKDNKGQPLYISGIIFDVTPYRNMEENTHKLASFPHLNPNPIVEVDILGRISYLNPAAKKLFAELDKGGNRDRYLVDLKLIAKKLMHRQHINREVKANGHWFQQSICHIKNINRLRIYGFNITKKKQIEEKIKANDKKLSQVINVTGAGYYEHAVDYSSGMVSKGFAQVIGFKLKELPKYPQFAKWFAKRIHRNDLLDFRQAIQTFYTGRTSKFNHNYRIKGKDGKWIWLQVIATPLLKNKKGLPEYVAGLISDITDRKKTEERLKESERMLRNTQAIARLGSWEYDISREYRYWSDETFRIYGYKPRSFIPKQRHFLKAVHPEDRKRADDAYFNSLKQNKDGYEVEYRVIQKTTGETRIVYEKAEHIKDEAGKPYRSIGLVQDITERKHTEESLKKSEEKFRKFSHAVEQSPASIVITDSKGTIEFVNRGFIKATGYSSKDAIGQNPRIIQSGKTPPKTYQKLWKTIKSGKEWKGELCNKKKNGEYYWEQVSISPVRDVTGKIINFLAVKNDITKLKETEEALKENEQKFRAVADTAKDAIISANSRGEIVYFNKGAEVIFGYSYKEVLDKSLTKLIPNEYREAHSRGFTRFLETKVPHVIGKTVEMLGMRKDGSKIPIELSLANWRAKNETFFTAIIRDITERKNLDQRKDDFITIASHELRTPVSAVKILTQTLEDLLARNPKALKYLRQIDQQASIQKGLINDLLDVTKIQTGQMEIRKEVFDLSKLVIEITEVMQQTSKLHNINVKGTISCQIFADRDRIGQVLINFLSNAIKFSPLGGKIMIKLSNSKENVLVSITDHGIGIPKESHDRIFNRFYRVYGSGKSYPGLGMGLYISFQIIKLHNGKVWFESKFKKGSTFYFSLPINKA